MFAARLLSTCFQSTFVHGNVRRGVGDDGVQIRENQMVVETVGAMKQIKLAFRASFA